MSTVQTVTPATTEPLSIAAVAQWLRIDDVEIERDRIAAAMAAAKQFIESVSGQRFGAQTVTIWLDRFPGPLQTLPVAPIRSVASIKYYDIADTERTVPAGSYYVYSETEPPYRTRIILKDAQSWPSVSLRYPNAVAITAACGHVEMPAVLGIVHRQLIAHYFQNPSATALIERAAASSTEIPYGAMQLINGFRLYAD